MEPMRAASLEDLESRPVDVPVKKPDGTVLIVSLRPLSEAEHYAIRQSVKRPERTIKEFQKVGGEVTPLYDDEKYARDIEANNARLNALVLLAMLPFTVAGTDDERIDAFRGKVGQSVFTQLVKAATRLNFISDDEVAALAATFLHGGAAGAPGDAAAGADAQPVAGAAAE